MRRTIHGLVLAVALSAFSGTAQAIEFDIDACYINPYGLTPAMFPTTFDGYMQADTYIHDKAEAYRDSAPSSPTGACMRAYCWRAEARARAQLYQEFVRDGIVKETGWDKGIQDTGEENFSHWADVVVGKCSK